MARERLRSKSDADTRANEGVSEGSSGLTIRDLAVPSFTNSSESVDLLTNKVKEFSSDISLTDAQNLMKQVQASQRNLTDCLNSLSTYRKAVARILEQRRRESAEARKRELSTSKTQDVKAPFEDI